MGAHACIIEVKACVMKPYTSSRSRYYDPELCVLWRGITTECDTVTGQECPDRVTGNRADRVVLN